MFLLDTNACIKILNNASPILITRLKSHHPSEIKLSSVVKAELVYGARKSARPAQNLRVLQGFFAPFRSLSFDTSARSNTASSVLNSSDRASRSVPTT